VKSRTPVEGKRQLSGGVVVRGGGSEKKTDSPHVLTGQGV